jgi:hypothetical protein
MQSLGYCCGRKYTFNPQVLCCYGKQLCTIPRDAKYYSFQNRYVLQNFVHLIRCHYICECGFLELFKYWPFILLIIDSIQICINQELQDPRVFGGERETTLPFHCYRDYKGSVLADVKFNKLHSCLVIPVVFGILKKVTCDSVFHLCRARMQEQYTFCVPPLFDNHFQQTQVCCFSGNFTSYIFIILNNM